MVVPNQVYPSCDQPGALIPICAPYLHWHMQMLQSLLSQCLRLDRRCRRVSLLLTFLLIMFIFVYISFVICFIAVMSVEEVSFVILELISENSGSLVQYHLIKPTSIMRRLFNGFPRVLKGYYEVRSDLPIASFLLRYTDSQLKYTVKIKYIFQVLARNHQTSQMWRRLWRQSCMLQNVVPCSWL